MKQLIINGELAFIDKDQYFPFTYKISDLEEINIINFPSTKSIMLPRNTQNDEIFGHIAEITRSNYGFSDNQSGVSFNQIKKANYELKNNSEIISEGIVRIVNITHNHYEVELYDKAIEILEELEDKEINDLEIINPVTGKPLEERINHETIKDMTVRDWGITPVFVDYDSNFTGNKIFARYNTTTGIGEKEIEFPREMTPFQMRTFSAADVPFTMHLTKMMDMIEAKQEVRFSEAVREQLAYVHMLLKKPKNGLSSTEYKLKADHKYLNRAEREYPVWHNYHVWTDDNQWYIVHNGNHLMKNDFKILFTTNKSQLNGNTWSHYKGKTYDDNTPDGTLIGMLNIKSQITLIHNDGAGTEYIKEVNTKVPMRKNRNVSYINMGAWSYLTVKGTFILNNDIYPKDKRGITMRANHSITNVVEKETTYPFDYTFDYNINSEILGTMVHKPLEFTEYDLLTSKKILPNITIKDFIINIAKTFNYNIKVVDGKLLVDIKKYNLANEGLLIDDDVEIDVNKVDFSRLKITSNNASSPLIEEYEEEYETWASKIVNTGYSIKKEEKEVELPYGTPLALTDYNYFAFDQYGAYLNGGYSKYPVGCIKGLEDGLTLGYLGINEETMYVSDAEIIENTSVISNRRLYRIAKDGLVEWKFDNNINVPVSILPKYATFLPYRFSEGDILESLEVNKPHYNFASVRDSQYPEEATLYNRFHKNMLEDKFNSNTHILNAKVFLFGEQDINKVYNYKNSHYIISELVEYDPTEPNMYEVKLMRVNQDLNYTLNPYELPAGGGPHEGVVINFIPPIEDIYVIYGTPEGEIPLPNIVQARMSDNTFRTFEVDWEDSNVEFDGTVPGEYLYRGSIVSVDHSRYIVAKVVVMEKPKKIISVENMEDIKRFLPSDAPILPSELDVLLEDGSTVAISINWTADTLYDGEEGTYPYTGELVLGHIYANPDNIKASVNFITKWDTIVSVPELEIQEIILGKGGTPTLVENIVIITEKYTEGISLDIQWGNMNPPYDNTVLGDYTAVGELVLRNNITNPKNLNVTQLVRVYREIKNIISVEAFESILVMLGGTEPELPKKAVVNFYDGTSEALDIEWEESGFNGDISRVYTYVGNLKLHSYVTNHSNLVASLNVVVRPFNIIGVETFDTINIEYNTIPELPLEIEVTLEDASTVILPINWGELGNAQVSGVHNYEGEIVLPPYISNTNNFKATVNVSVSAGHFKMTVETGYMELFFHKGPKDVIVEWGDGAVTPVKLDGERKVSHYYSSGGLEYVESQITIKGSFPGIFNKTSTGSTFEGINYNQVIKSIDQWGENVFTNMEYMFARVGDMKFKCTDRPNMTNVTSLRYMFVRAEDFNESVDIDTSNVTDMYYMFRGCKLYNKPVTFDTSKVTDFRGFFMECTNYNQPLSFSFASAEKMEYFLWKCPSFKMPIDHIDITKLRPDSLSSPMYWFFKTNFNEENSTINYDNALISWDRQGVINIGEVSMGNTQYSVVGEFARNSLISKGWVFANDVHSWSDGGLVDTVVSVNGPLENTVTAYIGSELDSLPLRCKATYSSGYTDYEPRLFINWTLEQISQDGYNITYKATGIPEIPIKTSLNKDIKYIYTVNSTRKPINIDYIMHLWDKNGKVGEEIHLGEGVSVMTTEGTIETAPVEWEGGEITSFTEEGIYSVNGVLVDSPHLDVNLLGTQVTQYIIIGTNIRVIQPIQEFRRPAFDYDRTPDISIKYKGTVTLPNEFKMPVMEWLDVPIHMPNSEIVWESFVVNWRMEESSFNNQIPGTYKITGDLIDIEGIHNIRDCKAEIYVTVREN